MTLASLARRTGDPARASIRARLEASPYADRLLAEPQNRETV